MRCKWILGMVLVGAFVVTAFAPTPANAVSPYSCNECEFRLFLGWMCDYPAAGESGMTGCTTNDGSCYTSGQACTVPAGGTGGSGGSGGGGGSCGTTGFCPAECFSCSGGGGRPAI